MSFLAKLFINDRVSTVLSSKIHFQQSRDITGRPVGRVNGGLFTLVIELDRNTDLLRQTLETEQMVSGYVRFYRRDGMSKLVDYEFEDTIVYKYEVSQTANGTNPALIEVGFSPGILKIGSAVLTKPWKVSDLNQVEVEPTPVPVSNDNPQLLQTYYTDKSGKRVEDLYEDILILVVESRGSIGKIVDIDLSDDRYDFKYRGQLVKDDLLQNIKITADRQEIELEVIPEQS